MFSFIFVLLVIDLYFICTFIVFTKHLIKIPPRGAHDVIYHVKKTYQYLLMSELILEVPRIKQISESLRTSHVFVVLRKYTKAVETVDLHCEVDQEELLLNMNIISNYLSAQVLSGPLFGNYCFS